MKVSNPNIAKALIPAAGALWEMASNRHTTKKRKSRPGPTKTKNYLGAATAAANLLGIATKTKTKTRRRRRRIKTTNFKRLNVKNDVDKSTRTYYNQKVTKQQARKIRRRFRNGSSPFQRNHTTTIVDTIPQQGNTVKWFWRTETDGSAIRNAWTNFINPGGKFNDALLVDDHNDFVINQEQDIYFSKFKTKYEIFNPTNYDMHLVIYDIVCKSDTDGDASTRAYNWQDDGIPELYSQDRDNPVACMYKGYRPVTDGGNYYIAAPGMNFGKYKIFDINFNPTLSYPFNIHWKIVGKKTITLQPGATMFHTFIHKPRALMSRGYYMYKYANEIQNSSIALENITSGTLFKVWGQLAADTTTKIADPTDDDPIIIQENSHAVTNLSGRLAIKQTSKLYWHCLAPKARFVESHYGILDDWVPSDEEELWVGNDVNIQQANDLEPFNDGGKTN